MLPEPKYAEWRPVAIRRWPTAWAGILVGVLVFAIVSAAWAANTLVFFLSAAVARYVTAKLVQRQLASLRDDAEGGQFAVTLRLAREVTYGYDEGLLAFENGWLVYSGRRCAFSLPASAVSPRLTDKANLSFGFGPPDDERTAFLTTESTQRFQAEAFAWRDAKISASEAVVLPPSLPNETAYAALKSITAVASVCFAATAVGAALLGGRIEDTLWLWLLLLLGVPLAAIYLKEFRHSLRALEKGLPRRTPFWSRPIGLRTSTRALPPKAED